MIRKFMCVFLSALLFFTLFAFVGCNNGESDNSTETKQEEVKTYRVKCYKIVSIGWMGDYETTSSISLDWGGKIETVEAGTYMSSPAYYGDLFEILRYYNARFVGWYLDSDYTTEYISRVENDIVLYAKYNRIDKYGTKNLKNNWY